MFIFYGWFYSIFYPVGSGAPEITACPMKCFGYEFLHPNSKTLIKLIHLLFKIDPQKWIPKMKPRPQTCCECCGAKMNIIQVQIKPVASDLKVTLLNPDDPLGIKHLLTM